MFSPNVRVFSHENTNSQQQRKNITASNVNSTVRKPFGDRSVNKTVFSQPSTKKVCQPSAKKVCQPQEPMVKVDQKVTDKVICADYYDTCSYKEVIDVYWEVLHYSNSYGLKQRPETPPIQLNLNFDPCEVEFSGGDLYSLPVNSSVDEIVLSDYEEPSIPDIDDVDFEL